MTVSGNTATQNGGAIYIQDGNKTVVRDSIFKNNSSSLSGGGLYFATVSSTDGFVMTGNTFSENTAASGGAIYFDLNSQATIGGGNTFSDNTASYGGAIAVNSSQTAVSRVDIQGSADSRNTFKDNTATLGGAVFTGNSTTYANGTYAELKVEYSDFEANAATYTSYYHGGGAICSGGTYDVSHVTMTGNTAYNGGAINAYAATGPSYIRASTLTGNSATSVAGAVYLSHNARRQLYITEGTLISGNTAGSKGGALAGYRGEIHISDSELSGNTAGDVGGAIGFHGYDYEADIAVYLEDNAVIDSNRVTNNKNGGGGIYANYLYITSESARVTNNTCAGPGGGICIYPGKDKVVEVKITAGTVYNNQAGTYGNDMAIYSNGKDFSVAKASDMTNGDEGSAWYDESSEIYIKDSTLPYQATTSTSKYYYYTYLPYGGVASVNGVEYETVTAAFEAIKAGKTGSDTTVLLLKDDKEDAVMPEGLTATLDLNGHDLTNFKGDTLTVGENSDLTLTDSSDDKSGSISGTANGITALDGSALTVTTASFKGCQASAINFGGASLTVKGEKDGSDSSVTFSENDRSISVTSDATVEVEGVLFKNNDRKTSSPAGGFGLYVTGAAKVTVKDSDFLENGQKTSSNANGGAIWINGAADVTVSGCVFRDNKASGTDSPAGGGAITLNAENGTCTVTDCTFTGNSSSQGGALRCVKGAMTVTGSTFSGNTATTSGGAIQGSMTVTDSTFTGNSAPKGGAAYNGPLTLTNVTMEGNKATSGNGGAILIEGDGHVYLDGCLIKGNKASGNGGGIIVTGTSSGKIHFSGTQSKVYDNDAVLGDDLRAAKVEGFFEASAMNVTGINCWIDTGTNRPYTFAGDINGRTLIGLRAANYEEETGPCVAKIDGHYFHSLQAAIDAAGTTVADGDETVTLGTYIYLVSDIEESVSLSASKTATVDLNGYTMTTEKTAFGFYLYSKASLTLTNTTTDDETNKETGGGRLVPGEELENSRGIYSVSGNVTIGTSDQDTVEISGFASASSGGAIYCSGGTFTMNGGTISDCSSATNGGAVFCSNVNSFVGTMNGGTITECSADGGGGAIYLYASGAFTMNGGTISDCSARGAGGAIYDYSTNVTINDGLVKNCTAVGDGGGIFAQNNTLTINGGTFSGCSAANGGAVRTHAVTVKVEDGTITDCRADVRGGGFWLYASNTTISNITISDCRTAYNGGGGGIHVNGGSLAMTGGTIKDCQIEGGVGYGGGLRNQGATVTLSNVTVSGCSAGTGGNIYTDGTLTLKEGCLIENGRANYSYGGGGIAATANTLTISGTEEKPVVIRNNSTTLEGGGIYWTSTVDCTFDHALIEGNSAGNGGGISKHNSKGSITITNTTIKNNTATTNGGGVAANYGTTNQVVIGAGSVVTENKANGYGGGVACIKYTGSDTAKTVYNKIIELTQGGQIYGNHAGLGQDVYNDCTNIEAVKLIKASDMFDSSDSLIGLGWLDEDTGEVYTSEIQGVMVDRYALTLSYKEDKPVCRIGETVYNSVQDAFDDIASGAKPQGSEIILIDDVKESSTVSSEVTATLNTNGYTLTGVGTAAVTVSGSLTLTDDHKDDAKGSDPGAISGSSSTGAALCIANGGSALLESAEIRDCEGSAVRVEAGSFTMSGGKIRDNAAANGGAVYLTNSAASFVMTGGEISGNSATTNGGAIYNNGGTVRLSAGEVKDNKAGSLGGAIYNANGKLYVTGSEDEEPVLSGNKAANGGAIYFNNGTAITENAKITGNTATTNGGGIYQNSGTLTLNTGTSITENTAPSGQGGAIYQNNSTLYVIGAEITRNTAKVGGGLAQNGANSAKASLLSGSIYKNLSESTESGNDIYSVTTSKALATVTLIPAANMGLSTINVWKDDLYSGTERLGNYIGEGLYIQSNLVQVQSVQLTADYYEKAETESDFDTDLQVSNLIIGTEKTGTSPMTDGTASFDKTSAGETSASAAGLTESSDTYIYNGQEYHYLVDASGKKYEQDQAYAWSAGDDSSATNNLVRTYDTVNYHLISTVEMAGDKTNVCKCTEACSIDDPNSECPLCSAAKSEEELSEVCHPEKTIRLWVEAVLPASMDEAGFNVQSAALDAYTVVPKTMVIDGVEQEVQVLSGYWTVSFTGDASNIEKTLGVEIYGMTNGETLKPTFKMWTEGDYETPAECASKTLTISSAPKYNISIDRNSTLAYTSYFDMTTGKESNKAAYEADVDDSGNHLNNIVYGTIQGYGVTVSLYNDETNKGKKGLELPADGLEFDLAFQGGLYLDGTALSSDLTAPYIWAYKENANTDNGRALNGSTSSVNMNWNDEDEVDKTTRYAYNAAPYNTGNNVYSCYNGGSWTLSGSQPVTGDQETVVHAKVTGYDFDGSMATTPNRTSDNVNSTIFNSTAVIPFTAGYVQVLFPFDPEDPALEEASGYVTINMDAVADNLEIVGQSGNEPVQGTKGKETVNNYYNDMDKTEQVCTDEINYADNYKQAETGLYIFNGDGPGDNVEKYNWFTGESGQCLSISGSDISAGDGATALGSTVYISGRGNFTSETIDTGDETKSTYIPDEVFNPQIDNKIEYDYMTAINILQKFDGEAYQVTGSSPIINETVSGNNVSLGKDGAFKILNNESATTWSTTKTKSYTVTILYAAKTDGSNWTKQEVTLPDGTLSNDGGAADMDAAREENLLYFETLDDLHAYFGGSGTCVGILYELRDCAIRTDRYVICQARAQVTDDFNDTGKTYCTTNDVRCWSTYRPLYKAAAGYLPLNDTYKERFGEQTLDDLLNQFSWHNVSYGNGAYGAPGSDITTLTDDNGYAYLTHKIASAKYRDGYVMSQYANGTKVSGTHNGWMSGNTLLLYTMDTSIQIENTDLVTGSNTKTKDSYNLSKGERTANFKVTPTLKVASGATVIDKVTNGSQDAEITITITLPEGLTYRSGTLDFDYDVEDCEYANGELEWNFERTVNEDGTETLTLKTYVNDIDKGLPTISYAVDIDYFDTHTEAGTQSFNTVAEIHAAYEEIHQASAPTHTASDTIEGVLEAMNSIYKNVGETLIEDGEDMVYTLHYRKVEKQASSVWMADVLPYVGDSTSGTTLTGRNSDFTGAYRVKEIKIAFDDSVSYQNFLNGGYVTWQAGQTVPMNQKDKNALVQSVAKGTKLAVTSTDAEALTVTIAINDDSILQDAETASGIALGAYLPQVQGGDGESLANGFVITVTLTGRSASGNQMLTGTDSKTQLGGNRYDNDFLYAVGDNPASGAGATASSQVGIRVIDRIISGLAFMDMNHDGIYDKKNDEALGNINAYLWAYDEENQTWVQAKDILGNEVASVQTASDGTYSFTNLAEGNYRVTFDDVDNDYSMKDTLTFGKLSVTTAGKPKDSVTVRSNGSYSSAEYTTDGTALKEAITLPTNEEKGTYISLPSKQAITSATYASPNWNVGLYYTEQTMEKVWLNNVNEIADGTSVTLTLKGQDPENVTLLDKTYTVTKTAAGLTAKDEDGNTQNVTVYTLERTSGSAGKSSSYCLAGGSITAEISGTYATEFVLVKNDSGYALKESDATLKSTETLVMTELAAPTVGKTYIWQLPTQILQAADANGDITYTGDETAWPEGFVKAVKTVDVNGRPTFRAENTQILTDLALTKVSMEDDTEIVKGATYALYTDEDCKTAYKQDGTAVVATSDEEGLMTFSQVEAGTYYIRETAVPKGYDLNKDVVKVVISYEASAPTTPVYTVTNLTTGETVTYTKTSGTPVEETDTVYTIAFKAFDRPIALTLDVVKLSTTKDGSSNDLLRVPRAVYGLYQDEACTTALTRSVEGEDVAITATSDDKGHMDFGDLPFDITTSGRTYYLKEVTPPDGYYTNNTVYSFTVAFASDNRTPIVTVTDMTRVEPSDDETYIEPGKYALKSEETSDGRKVYTLAFSVTDEPVPYNLPKTGGSGTLPYTVGGLAILAATAGGYVFLKRRKKKA